MRVVNCMALRFLLPRPSLRPQPVTRRRRVRGSTGRCTTMSAAPLLVSKRNGSHVDSDEQVEALLQAHLDAILLQSRPRFRGDDVKGSGFNVASFFGCLRTRQLGDVLIHSEEMQSTQDLMQKHLAAVPSGTVCVALRQSAGRGRRDNQWESPVGCLMFSLKWSLEIDPTTAPFLNYIVCLAIVRALRTLFGNRDKSEVDVRIKWPNDIYYDQQKIGGVLLNSSFRGASMQLVIGVGLNVLNEKPTTSLQQILESHISGVPSREVPPFSLEETAAEIMNSLEALLLEFAQTGFASMEEEYVQRWMHSGQRLKVDTSQDVTIKGITKSGYLLAVTDEGEEIELMPDGNTIDMMSGLVVRRPQPS